MVEVRLSQSSLRAWRRCRLMFNYRYVEKLAPRSFIRPLTFGSAVHRVLEYRAMGKNTEDAFKKVLEERSKIFTAEVDQFDQTMLDARRIMREYEQYYKNEKLEYVKVGKRRAEHEFALDIGQGIILEGIVDSYVETPDGRQWVVEHKSHKKIPTEDVRMRDIQTMLYSHAGRTAHRMKRVVGVMWDYLRSVSPKEPELLKNGTLSKKAIDTLPSVYEEVVKKHGLKVAHYQDKIDDLKGHLPKWFKRVFLPLNKDATKQLIEETLITGREIKRKAGVDLTRSISRDCSFCSYEKLCHAELFGMDADFIRQREFYVKEPKNEVEAED